MFRSFKYRLWVNANQERELLIALETHRRLWNECLSLRQMAYEQYGASVSYVDCCRWFTHQRKTNPFYARLNVHCARATLRRLDKAFVAFFRRCQEGAAAPGYPRFKGRDCFNSFTYETDREGFADGARLVGDRLRLQYVGTIRVKLHRPLEGKVKTITLKREADHWYVVLACELPDVQTAPSVNPPIDIDVGLTHFLTTSEGEHEPNPRYLKQELPELRRLQRAVSRKKTGSSNRRKAKRQVAKLHARVRSLRREQHHQVALKLVRRFGLVAVERLNVQGMLKNHCLARAIADAGWYGFGCILKHHASKAGVEVVEVDPRGTSQQCSTCGQEVRKTLSVRWHNCPHCGLSLDRDHNAALNILARGLVRTAPAGLNVDPEVKRVPRSRSRKATV